MGLKIEEIFQVISIYYVFNYIPLVVELLSNEQNEKLSIE